MRATAIALVVVALWLAVLVGILMRLDSRQRGLGRLGRK